MDTAKPIGFLRHCVIIQHAIQKTDDIGTPMVEWVPMRRVWVSLKPTHNYRQAKQTVVHQMAAPHYQLTARSNISYVDKDGNTKSIWDPPFRLQYKDFFLVPLVLPSIDPSKKWITSIVQRYPVHND